jgi:hypothetical protein
MLWSSCKFGRRMGGLPVSPYERRGLRCKPAHRVISVNRHDHPYASSDQCDLIASTADAALSAVTVRQASLSPSDGRTPRCAPVSRRSVLAAEGVEGA